MQDEGINVRAELATDERDAMRHQAADEMNVARQPVELGDGNRRRLAAVAGVSQGGG